MSEQKRMAALKADRHGFWHNDNPKCPHCGHELDIAERGAWDLYSEGEHEKECDLCGLEFQISTHVSYSFSTDDQPDDDLEDDDDEAGTTGAAP